MYFYGWGGVEKDDMLGYEMFCRGADQGYLVSMSQKGHVLINGMTLEEDLEDLGYTLIRQTAERGMKSNFAVAGYSCEWGMGLPRPDYCAAARWYMRANNDSALRALLHRHGAAKCCPRGTWSGDAKEQQLLVPDEVHHAQYTAMLVCKRRQVPHDVALIIAGYICTE